MPIVQAYKSVVDGRLFEEKADYQKHLRKLAAQRRAQKVQQKAYSEHADFIKSLGMVKDLRELEERIIKEAWRLEKKVDHFGGEKKDAKLMEVLFVERQYGQDLTKEPFLRWSDSVSNSHSAPMGMPQNWGGKKDLPRGYPGWTGAISIIAGSRGPSGSRYFNNTPINTGTGGGGGLASTKDGLQKGDKTSYDVKLFADDFPAMAKESLLFDSQCHKDRISVARVRTVWELCEKNSLEWDHQEMEPIYKLLKSKDLKEAAFLEAFLLSVDVMKTAPKEPSTEPGRRILKV